MKNTTHNLKRFYKFSLVTVLASLAFLLQNDLKAQGFKLLQSMELIYNDPLFPNQTKWVARTFLYKDGTGGNNNNTITLSEFGADFSYDTRHLENPRYFVIQQQQPILTPDSTYDLTQGRYLITNTSPTFSNVPSNHTSIRSRVTTYNASIGSQISIDFSSCLNCGEIFRVYFDVKSSSDTGKTELYPNGIDANSVYWNPSAVGFLANSVVSTTLVSGISVNPPNPAAEPWYLWSYSDFSSSGFKSGTGGAQGFPSFNIGGYATGVLVPLPVTYANLQAKQVLEGVQVKWTTSEEINNSHFNIERSTDGENWDLLGTVDGNGNSHQEISYSFTDYTPVNGLNLYRLEQVDFDGQAAYSDIMPVLISDKGAIQDVQLFPNPSSGGVSIQGIPYESMRVMNLSGKVLYENTNVSKHDLQFLDKGIYFIEIKGLDASVTRHKFLKD